MKYKFALLTLFCCFILANDQTNDIAVNNNSFNRLPLFDAISQIINRDTAYLGALQNQDQRAMVDRLRFHLSSAINNDQPSLCYFFLTKMDSVINNQKQQIDSLELQTLKAKIKSQWGIYYSMIGIDKKAIDFFRLALKYYNQTTDDSVKYGGLYYNYQWIASVHKKIGAYESSIQDNIQSLSYLNKYKRIISNPDRISDAGLYLSLSDAYLAYGDTLSARNYSEIAQKHALILYERSKKAVGWNSMITHLYLNLAKFHFSLGEIEKAKSYCEFTLQFPEKTKTVLADVTLLLGDLHRASQEYNKSLRYYIDAQQIISSFAEEKSNYFAILGLKLAHLYESLGNREKALEYYQYVLNSNVKDMSKYNITKASLKAFDSDKIINKSIFLDALQGIAKTNFKQFINSGETLHLENSQKRYDLAISLLDSMSNDYFIIEDKSLQISRNYAVYEEAILAAKKISELSQKGDQFDKIFELMEKSKAFTLNQLYASQYCVSELGSSLLEQEKLFKFEIKKREEELRNNKLPFAEDSLYAELIASFRSWSEKNKTHFLNYSDQFPIKEHTSLQNIQEALKKSNISLVEYFWGNNYLFTLTITPNHVKVYQQELGNLADSIRMLRTLITENASNSIISKIVQIQKISNNLYKRLLQPTIIDFNGEFSKLCIVRDGPLEYLPFEMLDLSPKFRPGIFNKDDFLLSNFTISYAQSSILWYKQQHNNPPSAKNFLACFAPLYQESEEMNALDNYPLAMLIRNGDIALPGAQIEAKKISRIAKGKLFKGRAASEHIFKSKATYYSVLHLSMHAFANDQIPESSELLFNVPNPDLIEDGHFKAWELHGLSLKAQMVVLSACQTGEGKIKRGEGALSLAYAFFMAGVPSVVSSQWSVHDEAAREIMEYFYRNLRKGMPKDIALQKAKKTYLEHGKSHPFFWAPFIVTGNTDQINFPPSIWALTNFVSSFFVLIILLSFFYIKYKKLYFRT